MSEVVNTEGSGPLLDITGESLREGLDECLSNIKSDGCFALFEALENPPNPGLHLKSGGLIGLPLSDRDAQAIVAASHQAPFGKGEETLVDTSVRKTWEVSPGDFELKNPAWQSFVQSVVTKVSAGLGVDATGNGVSAELYKMLLYDEGALFKPHQDSEKAPRMFGTMVIALPSKHEGGEVRVTHAGKTKIFETAKFSEYGSSYLAWFSDVTHEVKPVLSGRRLVLTYNLIHESLGSKELSANSNTTMAKLRLLLPAWIKNLDAGEEMPTSLAFLFEHQYTDASLCYDGLKGHDHQVASHLREACTEFGVCFYLANLDKTISGGCDDEYGDYGGYGGYAMSGDVHEIIDETDRETSLKRVVELDGTEVAQGLEFDEESFIQLAPLEDEDPDDEDYSGFTGNEGVSTTHFYHRTVAILVPRSYRVDFFLAPQPIESTGYSYDIYSQTAEPAKSKVLEWIERLSSKTVQDSGNTENKDDLARICSMVTRRIKAWKSKPVPTCSWREKTSPPFSNEVLARVVKLSVELDQKSLFIDAYQTFAHRNPHNSVPENSPPETFQSAGMAFLRYDLEYLLPKLSAQCAEVVKLTDRFEMINAVKLGLDVEATNSGKSDIVYQDWVKSEIDELLNSPQILIETAEDGTLLNTLAEQFPPKDIFNKILPTVKRNVHKTPMAVAFLTNIFDAGLTGKIEQSITHAVFKDIISDMADNFSLSSLGDAALASSKRSKPAGPGYYHRFSSHVTQAPVPDDHNSCNIATLLCHCLSLSMTTELDHILARMATESETVPIELFETIYLPFLKILSTMLIEKNFSVQGTSFQQFFQSLLSTYITRYVRAEPQTPSNWVRAKVTCPCSDCLTLNSFLVNPQQKIGRFPVAKKRREHLQQQLDRLVGFKHETERRGSPQTLVVTKTMDAHKASHKAWAERCVVARRHLQSFQESALRDLLGKRFAPTMALSVTQLAQRSRQLPPLSSIVNSSAGSAGRILPPITKRKVSTPSNVIVLDDSD